MKLVSKDKMRSEGIHSPDRAECVLGCMMPPPIGEYTLDNNSVYDLFSGTEEESSNGIISELGINVGY